MNALRELVALTREAQLRLVVWQNQRDLERARTGLDDSLRALDRFHAEERIRTTPLARTIPVSLLRDRGAELLEVELRG